MIKKKYCIFSAQYLPHMGGVENYTYHLAKELVEKGNEVTIITCNVERVETYEKQEGIKIYRLPCLNFINGRFPVLKFNKVFWKIHRKISKQSYDMIIINARFYIHSLYGAVFGKKKNCRTIFIEHGTGHLTLHNSVLDLIENIVEHTMTFLEKRLCSEFYGVSEACLEWLHHFHIRGKGVLYNAIDLDDINKKLDAPTYSFKEKYNIPKQAQIITFTGRLLKEKGVLTLVKAFNELKQENVYLFIAGDGGEYNSIRSMNSKHVILLGRITSDEIVALLKETDIFCLPSDSEGMPTSVLEAAACKCYIVTTKQGGAKELVLDEKHGIIMEDNSLPTVTKALQKVLKDGNIREQGVELTYQRLQEYFTWDKVTEKVMKL